MRDYQEAVLTGLLLNRRLEPRLEAQVRRIRNWPSMLRLLAVPPRRLRWILAASLSGRGYHPARADMAKPERLGGLGSCPGDSLDCHYHCLARCPQSHPRNLVAFVGWTIVALAVSKGIALRAVLLWLTGITGDFIERWLRQSADITLSFQVLFGKLAKVALFAAAITVSLSAVRVDLTALTVLSGAIGLGLGFGLQKVVSNLVSGASF